MSNQEQVKLEAGKGTCRVACGKLVAGWPVKGRVRVCKLRRWLKEPGVVGWAGGGGRVWHRIRFAFGGRRPGYKYIFN